MSADDASFWSGVLGLIFFIALFGGVLVYALWPGNRRRFKNAARAPLDEDDEYERQAKESAS